MRQQCIQYIVKLYVNNYTSACMADRLADEENEKKAADEFLITNKVFLRISKEELNEALDKEYHEVVEIEHSAFMYNEDLFK